MHSRRRDSLTYNLGQILLPYPSSTCWGTANNSQDNDDFSDSMIDVGGMLDASVATVIKIETQNMGVVNHTCVRTNSSCFRNKYTGGKFVLVS